MALGSKKNIIVGAASVFLADQDIALPAAVAGTGFGTTLDTDADWENVGYTQDGLEVATDPSFGEVEVDQLLDAAKIFKDGMGLSISTTFAEATLKNLMIAWGQQADSLVEGSTSTLTIEGGSLGEAPYERQLAAVGNGPELDTSNEYKERTYHAYRVLSVEGSSHSLARADATVIPVTFRALPDDDGKYGIVRDREIGTAV